MASGFRSSLLRRLIDGAVAVVAILVLGLLGWSWHLRQAARRSGAASSHAAGAPGSGAAPVEQKDLSSVDDGAATLLFAHNLELRKGPNFRVYIRWIRGHMLRTNAHKIPTFDDPDSFLLEIEKGVIDVKIADFSKYMSTVTPKGAPLTDITIVPAGDKLKGGLKLKGTLHKGVPMPVEVEGTLSPGVKGLVMFHVTKISAMKLPVKALMGALHLSIADLLPSTGIAGVHVTGNDLIFDTTVLMPPPHLHGDVTGIVTDATTIKVIYGGAHDNEDRLAEWHNFLQLKGGTLSFGKVTMRAADLTLIDASEEPWFDLDLVNYQAQLTNGYTLMTAQQGLQVFMPDLDPNRPGKVLEPVSMELLRDREKPIPGGAGK